MHDRYSKLLPEANKLYVQFTYVNTNQKVNTVFGQRYTLAQSRSRIVPELKGALRHLIDTRTRLAAAARGSVAPAEQKHRLLAEQVPEPPGRVEPQRLAPGVQRNRPLHFDPSF